MQVFCKDKFKAIRKAKGYTQKSLAEAIGTYEQHVQQWEYGKGTPNATYLLRTMKLLDLTPDDLLAIEL